MWKLSINHVTLNTFDGLNLGYIYFALYNYNLNKFHIQILCTITRNVNHTDITWYLYSAVCFKFFDRPNGADTLEFISGDVAFQADFNSF